MSRDEVIKRRLAHLAENLYMITIVEPAIQNEKEKQLAEEKKILLSKWIEELKVQING